MEFGGRRFYARTVFRTGSRAINKNETGEPIGHEHYLHTEVERTYLISINYHVTKSV